MAEPEEEVDPQEAFQEAIQADPPEGVEAALCTDWVVVAEWMDDEGSRSVTRRRPPDSTDWRMHGLLHYALYADAWGADGEDDDEDE